MSKTLITDVIVPDVFNPYVVERTAQLSAFYQSGVIGNDANLNRLATAGGNMINMPFWTDLDGDDEVLSDSSALTVGNIDASKDVARLLMRGRAWSVNDLAKALSGDDPMRAVGDLVAAYWARRWQAIIVSSLKGVFLAASMSGNVYTPGTKISAEETINALQKLGDAKDRLTAIAMHSATEAVLAKADLIDYVQPSAGSPTVRSYLGKRVIVDDTLPVAAGTYTTYLFGAGAIGYGQGSAPVPTETDRDSLAGDDILINRQHFIMHPRGVKWTESSVAGASPTNAELETAANWLRVYEAKNIRIVQYNHLIA